jgi:leucyl aminopeptidase
MLQGKCSLKERPILDLIILPFWSDEKDKKQSAIPAYTEEEEEEFQSVYSLANDDFIGKEGELLCLYTTNKKEKRVLLLGLGKKKSCSQEILRRCFGAAIKFCNKKKIKQISVVIPELDFCIAHFVTEGLLLANYAFNKLKTSFVKDNVSSVVETICLIGVDEKTFSCCKEVQLVVQGLNFTRDLVNGNADDVTPQMLSQTAKNLSQEFSKIKTTILGKKEIEKAKMGLLMAVSRGAAIDPAFIIMEYQGDVQGSQNIAVVGKGVTYDTGGLNLKPTGNMETMKNDMAGAAAVLGIIKAVAALNLKVNLVGVIPSTENSIGPHSYKPGDVYISYSGKSVEITNTDAEGRLILADAFSYIIDKYNPSKIIDLATLTGACVVALGEEVTGLFSNNDELSNALAKAGESTYERVWRLPLYDEYKECLKSTIADIKNCGERKASAITAAIFLQEFVGRTPFAHLDIAGTATLTKPHRYHTTTATGVGVRLIVEFLKGTIIS